MTLHTVIVVSPNPETLERLESIMTSEGYVVYSVESPDQALELIENNSEVHMIVSDFEQDCGPDGEFIQTVKRTHPEVLSVIVAKENALPAVSDLIAHDQIYQFILTPWCEENLLLTVKRGLEHYELTQQNLRLRDAFDKKAKSPGGSVPQSNEALPQPDRSSCPVAVVEN